MPRKVAFISNDIVHTNTDKLMPYVAVFEAFTGKKKSFESFFWESY